MNGEPEKLGNAPVKRPFPGWAVLMRLGKGRASFNPKRLKLGEWIS
jgi:hypothetical protein